MRPRKKTKGSPRADILPASVPEQASGETPGAEAAPVAAADAPLAVPGPAEPVATAPDRTVPVGGDAVAVSAPPARAPGAPESALPAAADVPVVAATSPSRHDDADDGPDADEGDSQPVVEMSAEEALAFLRVHATGPARATAAGAGAVVEGARGPALGADLPAAGRSAMSSRRLATRIRVKSALDSNCRVLTFESARVEAGMRVAGSTLARLYGMVRDGQLDVDLGPICQTLEDFLREWDAAPIGVNVVILANLDCASSFLSSVAEQRPEVSGAFWIVYETLRGEITSAKSVFLAEMRTRNRARAIGYGPRNVVEAARRGADAVRGHIEWGFGRTLAAAGD